MNDNKYIVENDLLKNITIKIDNEILGGCVSIKSGLTQEKMELREYLSSVAYGVINKKREYTITLKLTGNHRDYGDKIFCLYIYGKNFTVAYSNCRVLSDSEYSEKGRLYRELVVGAGERSVLNE